MTSRDHSSLVFWSHVWKNCPRHPPNGGLPESCLWGRGLPVLSVPSLEQISLSSVSEGRSFELGLVVSPSLMLVNRAVSVEGLIGSKGIISLASLIQFV